MSSAPVLRHFGRVLTLFLLLSANWPMAIGQDARLYDEKLARLSEILGAMHFLRELCGADDGQLWRQQMSALLEAEGSAMSRRARFANSFNNGYRSYRRTYQSCTTAAKEQTGRFLIEASELAKTLVDLKP